MKGAVAVKLSAVSSVAVQSWSQSRCCSCCCCVPAAASARLVWDRTRTTDRGSTNCLMCLTSTGWPTAGSKLSRQGAATTSRASCQPWRTGPFGPKSVSTSVTGRNEFWGSGWRYCVLCGGNPRLESPSPDKLSRYISYFSTQLHEMVVVLISNRPRKNQSHMMLSNTSQQDFGTRKVYCVSNVTFHAESKYAIKIFSSPTVFIQWPL